MSLQYLGLDEINGPLVFLDHVEGVGYEEMVEIRCKDGSSRMGRVVQLEGSRAAIQVFEGTNGLSLTNTRTRFKGKPMELPLSLELLGRVFNGSGRPIDGLGEIYAEKSADINGLPLNPVSRVYPRQYRHLKHRRADDPHPRPEAADLLGIGHAPQRTGGTAGQAGKDLRWGRQEFLYRLRRDGRQE